MAYVKKTWKSKETITDEALNNMENGIEACDTGKINKPTAGNGTAGQVLSTKGDGTTEWIDKPKDGAAGAKGDKGDPGITQQAAIADAAGGDEKDKINAILTALRAAGVIAAE